jgi:ParB-like chromosome segregation protein Spo0J
MDYPLDLVSPVRHVATELERAGDTALSIGELSENYSHPNPGDISRVRSQEHVSSNRAAHEWLIRKALSELSRYIEDGDGTYRLKVPFDKLRYKGRKVHRVLPRERWEDSFDPLRGKFTKNIRDMSKDRDKPGGSKDELRESLATFGWLPEFPALRDERGVVLVGHRRLKLAAELGIEPVMKTLQIGQGDEADARRFRIAIASNLGSKGLTMSDRQRLAEYLYGHHEWTMARIAEALNVAPSTIYEDVKNIRPSKKEERRGRPRKVTPEQETKIIELYFDKGGMTQDQVAQEVLGEGRSHQSVAKVIAQEEGRRERAEADKVTAQAIGRHTCTCDVCGRVDTHE